MLDPAQPEGSRVECPGLGIEWVISGGQTGVDQAGLRVGLALGIPIGGWVARGFRCEGGGVPLDLRPYLREADSPEYPVRTEMNVVDGDATVILTFGPADRGSGLTLRLVLRHRRPHLNLDLLTMADEAAALRVRAFVERVRPRVLNVAGNRESIAKGIGERAYRVLYAALS